ncbi:MAG: M12 family metallopeptidase [Candidatus Thiodiazotropha taylori]
MSKARKICYDKILPQDLRREQRIKITGPNGRARAIALKDKHWVNGATITVGFVGGTTQQQDMVKEIAPEWTKHANLEFVFTDDPRAKIRIDFDAEDGAWSYVGTDNLSIPLHAATMNLGWQDEGVILHEFGHMLGLSHEHQNPEGGIEWREDEVITDLGGPPNYWDEATVRHNVLNKYSADQINGTAFDPDSIMLYAFPGSWTVSGVGTKENEKLSWLDKKFIGSELYPGSHNPMADSVDLAVASAVRAEISAAGENDLFRFTVENAGLHTIQTMGSSDVVMRLYGPDNLDVMIEEDDNSGNGRNARLSVELDPGTYYVQIRHYDESATGRYSVLVYQ